MESLLFNYFLRWQWGSEDFDVLSAVSLQVGQHSGNLFKDISYLLTARESSGALPTRHQWKCFISTATVCIVSGMVCSTVSNTGIFLASRYIPWQPVPASTRLHWFLFLASSYTIFINGHHVERPGLDSMEARLERPPRCKQQRKDGVV